MRLLNFRPFFYGFAELSPAAIDIFFKIYLLVYSHQVIGLSASTTSLIIGLSVLWDAFIDPWIGSVSDRYKEKHGSRKPILFLASVAMAVLFFVLWRIPAGDNITTYIYLFVVCALLNSALSFFSVPYYAVANDLEKDDSKRRVWIGWRLVFFNIGSLVGLSVPAYFLTQNTVSSNSEPYLQAVTCLVVITLIFSFLATHLMYFKTDKDIKKIDSRLKLTLLSALKDKVFLQVLLSFFIVNCGLGLNSTLAFYYYKDFLLFTEKQTQIILVTFLLVFTASIPLWIHLTRFLSKKKSDCDWIFGPWTDDDDCLSFVYPRFLLECFCCGKRPWWYFTWCRSHYGNISGRLFKR